jgi:hypothetical protein
METREMMENVPQGQKILRISIAIAVMAVVIAAVVAPAYLPPPRLSLIIPDHVALGSDLEFTLQVDAWQGNYDIDYVGFLADEKNSSCAGKNGLFDRIVIAESRGPNRPTLPLGRLPIPRRAAYKLKVPLRLTAANGMLGRGRLVGEVAVSLEYETQLIDPHAGSSSGEVRRFQDQMLSLPYSIQIQ